MAKLKKSWEENVNKRKPKPSKICKVHKGAHVYQFEKEVAMVHQPIRVWKGMECLCGKRTMVEDKWEMGEKICQLFELAKKNRNITDINRLISML